MLTAVIIGGGLGGLFTGALLSKEGFRVTIVEKNATIGGGLQTFTRFGERFDTGMHVIGGMHPGGNIRRLCEYLGIMDRVKIRPVDDDCTDALYFAEDQKWYRIAKGRKGFIESLASEFPDEREGLEQYVDAIFQLADQASLFNLRPSSSALTFGSPSPEATTNSRDGQPISLHASLEIPADSFIASFVKNPQLRSILAYMNPLYGGRGNQTPAYVHAIISVLYIHGADRFVDGSSHFADLLAELITKAEGEIIKGDAVAHVSVENKLVTSVETQKGRVLTADKYISAIHPCTLFPLLDEGALPKSYRNRLDSIPNSYSAFSLYIKMKPNTFPYINHSEYYMTRYEDVWNFGRTDKPWPLGFLMMTPPDEPQTDFARKVLVTAPMSFEEVRQWEHTTVGHRGPDYEEWKRKKTESLLKQVEEIHPGFRCQIEAINSSSPLTIRDYYGAKEGGLSGFSKDAHNIVLSQVPVVTKIRNLYLTGQNNNLHGFCGVPLTAINTCEAILGQNYIINQLNSVENQ